jgi:hypothetical protein
MRLTTLACLALVGSAFAVLALPTGSACSPDLTVGIIVPVDVYDSSCLGVIASVPNSSCVIGDIHQGPIHVYPSSGSPCTVGVLIT